MIRVLHILDELNTGGAENIVVSYLSNIDRTNFHWDFVCMNIPGKKNGRLEKVIEDFGCNIYKVTKKQKNIFKNWFEIDKIIKNGNYDIVHSHLYEISAIYLLSARCHGVPVRIAHSHSSNENRGLKVDLLRLLLKPLLNSVVTTKCACGIDAGISLWGKKEIEKVTIINNAINTSDFKYSDETNKKFRQLLNIKDDTIVLGSVGRLQKQKNSNFLIDIFYEFRKLNSNSVLILVGEGEDEDKVKNNIINKGLTDNVLMLGRRNDVNDILNVFDHFILPSLYEGLPIVSIEAQCNGIKCWISDTITDEMCLSEDIKRIPLSKGPEYWAKLINCSEINSKGKRENSHLLVARSGYEISSEAKKLEIFYKKELGVEYEV